MDELLLLFENMNLSNDIKEKNKQIIKKCANITNFDNDLDFLTENLKNLSINRSDQKIENVILKMALALFIKSVRTDVYNLYVKDPPMYSQCH